MSIIKPLNRYPKLSRILNSTIYQQPTPLKIEMYTNVDITITTCLTARGGAVGADRNAIKNNLL